MSQTEKLVKHLIEGNAISGLVAERNYGIERLPSRIHDICKVDGFWGRHIQRKMKTAPGSRKKYMEYRINPIMLGAANICAREDFPKLFAT
jgi:hypothetical protein